MRPAPNPATHENIIVFGDVHYASYWDQVADAMVDWEGVINPNAELTRFLAIMAKETSPFAAVNLGDALDYFLCDYDGGGRAPLGDNRALFYATLDAAGFACDEVPGNHDHRLSPHNLRFWGLGHINLAADDCRRVMAQLGHQRLRNPLAELRSLARVGSPIDPLQTFRGFLTPTFAQRASFDCLFLNTGGDDLARVQGLGRAAKRWMYHLRRAHAGGTFSKFRLSIDCVGFSHADLERIAEGLPRCTTDTIVVFMHAPLINPVCCTLGATVQLELHRLRASLHEQGFGQNVVAAGGGQLLHLLRAGDNAGRNVIIVAAHVHTARYILIDKQTLIARQVDLEDLNAAWTDARFIKHATVLPLGVIDDGNEDPRTGFARISPDGFEEVVVTRVERRARRSVPLRTIMSRTLEPVREIVT